MLNIELNLYSWLNGMDFKIGDDSNVFLACLESLLVNTNGDEAVVASVAASVA